MFIDQAARNQATDPTLSCIVQAPAGSGKTEILTQRFLRLLSVVQYPEQIIALTFTRKAANEMRERVIKALISAEQKQLPQAPHQLTTYQYAKAALLNDETRGWQLLKMPMRLKITTIDSLCQSITQAIPLQEKQTPYANTTDNPEPLYLAAARACFLHAVNDPTYQPALETLLNHLDNRQDLCIKLLSEQLTTRDQWLRTIFQARLQQQSAYETALEMIEAHEIDRFKVTIPKDCIETLITLSRQVAMIEANPSSPRYQLCTWHDLDALNSHTAQGLAALLLTSQGQLRKKFDHHVGLKRGNCAETIYQALKAQSQELLTSLAESPDFLNALIRVSRLPPPIYAANQWQALQALFSLLPLLAAHLQLIFNETNEIDFTEIARQAETALRAPEGPTDLALYLDHRIHHLLIDEFQDTSMQQFEFITQLVEGFEPHDGKTLFVVGDPMQSIYRFRAAEVGLFLRAKRSGIGPVQLTPLELRCNFRSSQTMIDWINHHFRTIFPKQDDLASGAICYHPATPIHQSDASTYVHAFQYDSRLAEAEGIMHTIVHELNTYPDDHIALLVRSRSQLTHIIRALRRANIPYQGVDIDWLAKLPHVRDVWSLTQALLMPGHRLAWLAFLRSPWCGLSLEDLHHLANINRKQSVYAALACETTYLGLSASGRDRARYVFQTLQQALTHRHQQSLASWILNTLHHLHIHKILTPQAQDDLEQYWLLLEKYEVDGQISDLSQFKTALNTLYSKQNTPSRLHIMTIHKAKGLEFDCVILPCLSAKASGRDKPLLRWLSLPTDQQQDPLMLISPLHAAAEEHCPLYDYLGRLDQEKDHYEQQRLLYVAATRAKKRLYLFDHQQTITRGTLRSLLATESFQPLETTPAQMHSSSYPVIEYLPNAYYSSPQNILKINKNTPAIKYDDNPARLIGIAAHQILQWICEHHPQTVAEVPWELAHYFLKQNGLDSKIINLAAKRLHDYIAPLFTSPKGQWLIRKHLEERTEYELLIEHENKVHTRIIDRTFYDQGICWIIDFKTGREDQAQETQHRNQVNQYANYLRHTTTTPIRCGLYYLNLHHWIEWDPSIELIY